MIRVTGLLVDQVGKDVPACLGVLRVRVHGGEISRKRCYVAVILLGVIAQRGIGREPSVQLW